MRSSPLMLVLAGLAGSAALYACHGASTLNDPAAGATLRVDSAVYGVRYVSPLYRAQIPFVFVNHTKTPLSQDVCYTPDPPALEKDVGGRWMVAYQPVLQMCQSAPFIVAAGATYHGTLYVAAGLRGGHVSPMLLVDSVPGEYRLRWALRSGRQPTDPHAPLVKVVSPTFHLVMR